MLEVSQARERILAITPALAVEEAPIAEALGRALAEDVVARRTLPPWNNSAMDGYAVRAADLARQPTRLEVIETIYAGQTPRKTVGPGQCARIMTGAPLPDGADAVVMQEKTKAEGTSVEILEPVPAGASVRLLGEDARAGERLLARGTSLGIPEGGLLWGQGLTAVRVPARPRVALVSTGDELVPVGTDPGGRIIDTNTPALAAAVKAAGGLATPLGIARDTLEDVTALLERTAGFDLVLTVAGVSVGDRDFVRPALEKIGVRMDFWKVALRPGKPLAAGRRGQTLFLGLPGNPTSALVTFELFVRPAIRRMLGHAEVDPPASSGVTEVALQKAAGLTHFIRARAEWREGKLRARPLASQTSGALTSAATATHLMVFPADATALSPGDPVQLLPVSWAL